jgi:uncharacterized protein
MTDTTATSLDQAGEAGRDLSPFERWLDAARPKAKLWRLVVGVVIAVAIWIAWTLAVMFGYAIWVATGGHATSAQAAIDELVNGASPAAVMTLLVSFLGLWFGVWAAVRLMHGQAFWAIVSPEKTIRWRDFVIGLAIIAGYFALNLLFSMAAGLPMGERSDVSLLEWAAMAAPICVLVFFQASGEELLFRGYVTQQLAARFRNPLIWGLLPSLAFGAIHYSNGSFAEYSTYYMLATTLFALAATVSVWRTGSLSMAMGMHTANNIGSFLFVGMDDSMNATQLWLWRVEDIMQAAPYDILLLTLLLAFMLSPWAPMPKRQLFAFRKETRAAP